MTPKQQAFVGEYLKDLNAVAAAERAGYAPASARYAARDLLPRPEVKAAIENAMVARGERTRVTADRVLLEAESMALLDVGELTKIASVDDIALLPIHVRRAIVGWKFDRFGQIEIKTAKEGALKLLMQHHGLLIERLEHTGNITVTVQNLTGADASKPWRKPGA